jgi:aryl-alcohol dehydrogenase-like predicted oxidoreductase
VQTRSFGSLGSVSALSLGGGGIGGTWGPRERSESIATVHEAVERGVTLIDVAPAYGAGEAETVVGLAFAGRRPPGVRIATKAALLVRWSLVREDILAARDPGPRLVAAIEDALAGSEARLNTSHVDIYFLHDPLIPDAMSGAEYGMPLRLYVEVVRPALERLVAAGRIGAWGISGTGAPTVVAAALDGEPAPAAAQIEANVLRSRRASQSSDASPGAFELTARAYQRGVGVMAIRPTESGALTDAFDRPVDEVMTGHFQRAAPFRALARELGSTPAELAHRYALSLTGVSTVTLGVKNRTELREALAAEERGPLAPELVARIDASVAGKGVPLPA